jgi:hypothetical protein
MLFQIVASGKHVASSGLVLNFSDSDIQYSAIAYNETNHSGYGSGNGKYGQPSRLNIHEYYSTSAA